LSSPERSGRVFRSFAALIALFLSILFLSDLPAAAQSPAASTEAAADAGKSQDPQLKALIDALRNDETRTKLLDALEKANSPAAETPEANRPPSEDVSSVGRRIAEFTQSVAENAAQSSKEFALQLASIPQRFAALGPDQIDVLMQAVWDVALAIVTTYVIFLLLRWAVLGLFRRIGRRAAESGVLRRILLIIVSAAIDAGVVLLAWAGGYLITLTAFGDFGTVGLRQSLYLNAFLLVEMFKVVLRIVLSPATGDLRLINIGDAAARLLNNRLTWIAVILGYGQLFVAPVLNQSISPAAGQAMSVVFALVALGIGISMTVRHRQEVKNWLLGETTGSRSPSRAAQMVAKNWYWAVLAYFAFLFIIVLTRPAEALLPVLAATAEVIVALLIGLGLTGWLARAKRRGVRLPEHLTRRLPLLESRLNAFIPRLLNIVRVAVVVIILAIILNITGAIDVGAWMETQFGARATSAIVAVLLILLAAFAIWLAMTSWVDYRLNPDYGSVPTSRESTLLTLLRNAATIALVVITLMFVLSEIGINIAPLIASAGVIGLAIGFGAQKLVQDIITGIFIQLENAINVGDVVTAGGVTGTAERLTIRSLSIRDLDGTYHIIPFSSVDTVSNFMKGFSYAVCTIGVGYRENYDEVREAMFEAFEMLKKDPDCSAGIIGDIAWDGITQFADNAVMVRARIKTTAGAQWGVGRAYNTYIKKVFDARDIDIPVPQRTILFGRDKKGNAVPAHVRIAEEEKKEGIPPVINVPPAGEPEADETETKESRQA
jgi:small-conductance mechanosensitive channel